MELDKKTRREREEARAEAKAGKAYAHEQVKKKLGL